MKKSLLSLLTVAALVLAPACCMDRCEKPCNPRPACPKKVCCPKKCPKVCKKRCKPICPENGYDKHNGYESGNVSSSTSNGYASNNRAKKTTTRKVAARQPRASKKA